MGVTYCFCPFRPSFRPSVCHTCFCSITEERLGVGTSYLVCRLVMTSSWPLLILITEGQWSRSWWPCEVKNGFRSITEERFGRGTPYLVCRLAMPSRRPLLISTSKVKVTVTLSWKGHSDNELINCFCLGLGTTSYLVCRLVTTSKWPLLILRSLCQRSRSQWSSHICHTCFRSITEERLGIETSYLVCRLVMTSRCHLLILMSEG